MIIHPQLWKYPEEFIQKKPRQTSLVTYELSLSNATFADAKIVKYELALKPLGNKVGLNLMDDEYFIIPYIYNTIPNLPEKIRIAYQKNQNVCIVEICVE